MDISSAKTRLERVLHLLLNLKLRYVWAHVKDVLTDVKYPLKVRSSVSDRPGSQKGSGAMTTQGKPTDALALRDPKGAKTAGGQAAQGAGAPSEGNPFRAKQPGAKAAGPAKPSQPPAGGPKPANSANAAPKPAAPNGPGAPAAAPSAAAFSGRTEPAGPARRKWRHVILLLSFVLFVAAPGALAGWYLYTRAADQYASYTAFSVRSEDVQSSLDLLAGFSAFGAVSSKDVDILFEYIQSQGLVKAVDEELDLRAVYGRNLEIDPVFSFDPSGTIEDLHEYWSRMIKVYYDRGTGLVELRVNAFAADDAQRIAETILRNGTELINALNAVAREDATRYAREELERSVERLRTARQAITAYRSENQLVDPAAEIGIQTGLISALQTQLSEVMVDYNLLKDSVPDDSLQVKQLERRIEVLRQSIDDERLKFGSTSVGDANYSALVGEYEGLMVDLEFAEQAYVAALAAFDSAQVEAQRKSRYLAAYIEPTLAERAEYPKRMLWLGLIVVFAFFLWSIGALIFYALRDRR